MLVDDSNFMAVLRYSVWIYDHDMCTLEGGARSPSSAPSTANPERQMRGGPTNSYDTFIDCFKRWVFGA